MYFILIIIAICLIIEIIILGNLLKVFLHSYVRDYITKGNIYGHTHKPI